MTASRIKHLVLSAAIVVALVVPEAANAAFKIKG